MFEKLSRNGKRIQSADSLPARTSPAFESANDMKILNFGSLNIDFVYSVDHIVQPGETIASTGLEIFCGGKGLNQSIALARAGADVSHAGMVGPDGGILIDALTGNGVDASLLRQVETRSGNAIIQVGADGQNCIVLYGGANRMNDRDYVDAVVRSFAPGDILLLQNEINLVDDIIARASAHGMVIALNPSPFDSAMTACDLDKVSVFIMNEVEGEQITGRRDAESILQAMADRYPEAEVVLTLGGDGAVYQYAGETVLAPAIPVPVVDTTAAGDTFTGYFLAARMRGETPAEAMRQATRAAALAVSRPGATPSIPVREEVLAGL